MAGGAVALSSVSSGTTLPRRQARAWPLWDRRRLAIQQDEEGREGYGAMPPGKRGGAATLAPATAARGWRARCGRR